MNAIYIYDYNIHSYSIYGIIYAIYANIIPTINTCLEGYISNSEII